MTPAFKHRLLGTAILVMAGIIFLPDLLDGEKQIVKDDFKVIPNRPEFKGVQQQQVLTLAAQFANLLLYAGFQVLNQLTVLLLVSA